MIVESLVRYYDILAADTLAKISKLGYSPGNVSFALAISKNGELTNIVDLRADGKKKTLKSIEVPYQKSRAVAVTPFFACDNAKYIFGIDKIKDDGKKKAVKEDIVHILEDLGKERIVVSRRSIECFGHSRLFHHMLLDGIKDPGATAFLKFLDNWKPEASLNHPKVAEFKEEILSGGMFVFDVDGTYLHDIPEVRKSWESQSPADDEEDEPLRSQCLVSGKIVPIARIHQKIKGVLGAQSAGATLIGFNDPSFESYGKSQSYNAPVSEDAMFKYTTALNHLLERGSRNRIQIGDTSTVFWAETTKQSCGDLARFLIDPVEVTEADDDTSSTEVSRQDAATRQLVSDILGKVRSGEYLREKDLGVDPETTKFYILGLSPNNARIAVRFWHEDSFGNFIQRVARHHLDMEIERDDRGPRYISVYRLLRETVPQNSSDKASSPLLGGLLMRSILENTPYPVPMYNAILNRAKVERSINSARAGFIKACLIRMKRARKENEEEITVSLNEESTNVPYRLGRLFAVLEKTQSDTNRDMKSTINSKYFSSASTTPAVVFPVLLKLSQHHIAKSDWGFKSDRLITDITDGISEIPASLTLEEQGMFMLGYYHQKKANFKKKEGSEEKKESEKMEGGS